MRLTRITLLIAICTHATTQSWAQTVPMTNDECSTSIQLSPGVNPAAPAGVSGHVYSNVGATASAFFPPVCNLVARDVWFFYLSSVSGLTTVSTCTPAGFAPGSLADTYLAVHDAACPSPNPITCNDDLCGSRSSVTFLATAGHFYTFRIGGPSMAVGTFYVVVTPPVPPPNDECSGAIALSMGQNGPFSNAAATDSIGSAATCGVAQSPGYRDLWFSLTTCGAVTIDTCGGSFLDTILQVFDVCGGGELACNDDAGGGCGFTSLVTVAPAIQTTYRIRASAWSPGAIGNFPINVTPMSPPTSVAWSAPWGPGSIEADLSGPQNGSYFLAITTAPGAFPNGWLFGLDISYAELVAEYAGGFPYTGPLDPCGHISLGPFQGLPSGFAVYSVAFGFLPGNPVPSSHSAAVAFTVP